VWDVCAVGVVVLRRIYYVSVESICAKYGGAIIKVEECSVEKQNGTLCIQDTDNSHN
jgi:hypothetical protein